MTGLGAFSCGGKRLGVWRGLQGTGDLTSAIRVQKINSLDFSIYNFSLSVMPFGRPVN